MTPMQLSAVNLKPYLLDASPDWKRDVFLSQRAVAEMKGIAEGA